MKKLKRNEKISYWNKNQTMTEGIYLEEKEGKHAVIAEKTGEIEIVERKDIYKDGEAVFL